MVKSMLANKDFQTWHLIGWQHSRQPIRSHVRKSLLINMEFNMDFCLVTPRPDDTRNQGISDHAVDPVIPEYPGGRLNIKMSSYQYRDSHVGNPIPGKDSLYIETEPWFQYHSTDSSIKLSDLHTTQTQTSELRWGACFIGHWVVTSMFP